MLVLVFKLAALLAIGVSWFLIITVVYRAERDFKKFKKDFNDNARR